MASNDLSGWAMRRNGSCLADSETSCGQKLNPFFACCPSGTRCQDGRACCPSGSSDNCTQTLVDHPSCGNKTWDLYDFVSKGNGYFCCDPASRGYGMRGSVGCLSPGASFDDVAVKNGAKFLSVIQKGVSASTSATASATASPATATPTNSSSRGSSNTGAIAGGVVGGVLLGVLLVALLWFWRRRVKAKAAAQNTHGYPQMGFEENYAPTQYEQKAYKHNIHASARTTRAEFPDNPLSSPIELGGQGRTLNELPGSHYGSR